MHHSMEQGSRYTSPLRSSRRDGLNQTGISLTGMLLS